MWLIPWVVRVGWQAGKDFADGFEEALGARDASIKALLAENDDGAPRGSVDSSQGRPGEQEEPESEPAVFTCEFADGSDPDKAPGESCGHEFEEV